MRACRTYGAGPTPRVARGSSELILRRTPSAGSKGAYDVGKGSRRRWHQTPKEQQQKDVTISTYSKRRLEEGCGFRLVDIYKSQNPTPLGEVNVRGTKAS